MTCSIFVRWFIKTIIWCLLKQPFTMNLMGFSTAMDGLAWRGLVYTVFILHFVFACQLLLLQPLVSATGLQFSLFDLFTRTCYFLCWWNQHAPWSNFAVKISIWFTIFTLIAVLLLLVIGKSMVGAIPPTPRKLFCFSFCYCFLFFCSTEQCPVISIPACFCPCALNRKSW